MKRLIKKSEICNAVYNRNGKYIEIYKNPTHIEFERCKQQNEYDAVRLFIDLYGNVFVWDMEALHDEVVDKLNAGKGFKCELESDVFGITIGPMYNLKENLRDAFLDAKNILDENGISNCRINWDSYLNKIDSKFLNNLNVVSDIYNIEID